MRLARWSRLLLAAPLLAGLVACGGNKKDEEVSTLPKVSASQRAQAAISYLQAGRTSDAIQSIQTALTDEPENPRLHYVAGQIYLQTGRYEEAETAFQRSLELDPYLTDSHNYLGAVYAQTGRPAEAERQYRKALEDPAYPSPDHAYFNLGILYMDRGREGEALTQFRRAVELNPKHYRAQYEQAMILDRRGQLDQAVRLYEVAEPGLRNSGDFHYRLGVAYFKLDQREKSRQSLRRCLDVAPGSESAAKCSEMLDMLN